MEEDRDSFEACEKMEQEALDETDAVEDLDDGRANGSLVTLALGVVATGDGERGATCAEIVSVDEWWWIRLGEPASPPKVRGEWAEESGEEASGVMARSMPARFRVERGRFTAMAVPSGVLLKDGT